jgi:UPF0755 protein
MIKRGFLIVFACLLFIAGYSYCYLNTPLNPTEVRVLITKGTSINGIAKNLQAADLIKDHRLFKLVAIGLTKCGSRLQAGEYMFAANITPLQILREMIAGNSVIRKVVIPEGYTNYQILELLAGAEGLEGEIEPDFKEGELMPDTYHYSWGDKRQCIIDKMKKAMTSFIAEAWAQHHTGLISNTSINTPEQAIILASIIEKETALEAEKPLVSAVYHNRLRIGMPLQADPTVLYAVTEGRLGLERRVTYNDLKIVSPYNTYLYRGLPPTPIANPGRASILAAMNPAVTKDIYFVADGLGGHVFASGYAGHKQNVQKYREAVRKMLSNR